MGSSNSNNNGIGSSVITNEPKSYRSFTEGKLVALGVIGTITAFVVALAFIGGGGVRHVPITFNEIISATVAFRDIDGETKIVGITGNTQVNPSLVSRTGSDMAYVLTVINQDDELHMLYIDGLNLHTKILRSGESDTITVYPKGEGLYNYYDRLAVDLKVH
ncbi:MAG: hypothetical protein WBX01_08085 [Nitrososphaeraceae archaeon]